MLRFLSMLLGVLCLTAMVLNNPVFAQHVDPGSYASGKSILPAWPSAIERHPDRLRRLKNAQFRNNHPEMYGVTQAPLQPVFFYPEFSQVDAVYYIWFPGMEDDFYWTMTQAIAQYEPNVQIGLLVEGSDQEQQLRSLITQRGGDPDHPAYIDLSSFPQYDNQVLDSVWTVDSGPFWVTDGAGQLAAVDLRYYFERVNDDAIPYKLTQLLDLDDFRPDLDYEGGNLTSDGQGTCMGSTVHLLVNLPHLPSEVEAILGDYLGCRKMIWLEPLAGEGTGHMDMFSKLVDPGTVLVGQYETNQDSENADLLDRNAAVLAGEGYQVVRIPMPDNDNRQVWRTYTNSLVINDLVLVPTYAQDRGHEDEALSVYRSVYPGKTVVGVDSDGMIAIGGAIHCVTRTRPVATHAHMQAQVPYECGGAWYCTSGCGDIDYTGACVAGQSVFCDNGSVSTDDCAGNGLRCGWDVQDDYINCVDQGCGAVTAQGECKTVDGVDFAVWCEDGYPLAARCGATDTCGLDQVLGHMTCQGVQVCTDECQAGQTGCSQDAQQSWTCGEANDGDDCLDKVFSDCGVGRHCDNASCVPDCTDECQAGQTGCSQDAQQSWTCGEANDGDDCLDKVFSDCGVGRHCENGSCVAGCTDECQAGQTGCSQDAQQSWTCGEANDGDDCLDKVFSDCGAGRHCDNGSCVAGCADECQAGQTGCSQDAQQSWTCGEANDGDDCLDKVFSDCGAGRHCDNGSCAAGCADECQAGQSGCLPDGKGIWVCGEAGDGDDCLDRIESNCAEGDVCVAGRCEVSGADSSKSSGCGCRSTSGRGVPLWPLGFVLGLLGLLKRRCGTDRGR